MRFVCNMFAVARRDTSPPTRLAKVSVIIHLQKKKGSAPPATCSALASAVNEREAKAAERSQFPDVRGTITKPTSWVGLLGPKRPLVVDLGRSRLR